jgi:hypothetical protein
MRKNSTEFVLSSREDTKLELCLCRMCLWTLLQAPKLRLIQVSKVGNWSAKIQHPWHQALDTKHFFLHVKFEVRFVISFMRKSTSNKTGHFSWRMVHPFCSKSGVWKLGSFLVFWTGGRQNTICLCKDISNNKVVRPKKSRSFIHTLDTERNSGGRLQITRCAKRKAKCQAQSKDLKTCQEKSSRSADSFALGYSLDPSSHFVFLDVFFVSQFTFIEQTHHERWYTVPFSVVIPPGESCHGTCLTWP